MNFNKVSKKAILVGTLSAIALQLRGCFTMSGHDIRLFLTVIFIFIAAFSDNIFTKESYKKYKYVFAFLGVILAISLLIV